MRKSIFFGVFVLLIIIFLTGAGCVQVKVPGKNGGVFKSEDKIAHWKQMVAVPTIGKEAETIASVNVIAMVLDPQDSQTIYLGTAEDGTFVSYDGANSWRAIKNLPKGIVNAIQVDPKAKHIIYLAIENRIFKSADCCRTWDNVYLEAREGILVTALAIDFYDSNRIYAGLSDGRLIVSTNAGDSWSQNNDFKNSIKQILINSKDTRIVYVATERKGIYRSADLGSNWQDLSEGLKDYSGSRNFSTGLFDPRGDDSLIIATDYGLLRSDDGGKTWQDYKLLVQPKKLDIYALALNPKNPNEMYYTTPTAIYKSVDGGVRWITKSLPSKRAPVILLVDPVNPNNLYLGVREIKEE